VQSGTGVPALKRRAILKCPSGTGCGVSDAAGEKGFEQQEMDECRQNLVQPVPDPNYTVPKGLPIIARRFSAGKAHAARVPQGRLTIAHGFRRG